MLRRACGSKAKPEPSRQRGPAGRAERTAKATFGRITCEGRDARKARRSKRRDLPGSDERGRGRSVRPPPHLPAGGRFHPPGAARPAAPTAEAAWLWAMPGRPATKPPVRFGGRGGPSSLPDSYRAVLDTGLPGRVKSPRRLLSRHFRSFPRKRESRDFSHLPWVPAFARTTLLDGRQGFFTACFAGVTGCTGRRVTQIIYQPAQ
jgi:hypothetical protein